MKTGKEKWKKKYIKNLGKGPKDASIRVIYYFLDIQYVF